MEERSVIKSYLDLEVYKEAYKAAMEIFWLTRKFPKEEIYSLTSQIVRSSRSIPANISEGWGKRSYENVFKQHLTHALGSCFETNTWLRFAGDCSYLEESEYQKFFQVYELIGKKLNRLHQKWKTF